MAKDTQSQHGDEDDQRMRTEAPRVATSIALKDKKNGRSGVWTFYLFGVLQA
jgi:hypothetical protein